MGAIFFDLRASVDEEWVFADGSYIRCHQHSSGARRGELRATGKSRDGTTTKIHLAVDSHGNPIDFKITGGDVHDSQAVDDIIEMLTDATYFIADKAYDSDPLDAELTAQGVEMIAPHKRNRKKQKTQDGRKLRRYKRRWKVERLFAWLHKFRRVVVRYDYHAENFLGFVHLACIKILLRCYL